VYARAVGYLFPMSRLAAVLTASAAAVALSACGSSAPTGAVSSVSTSAATRSAVSEALAPVHSGVVRVVYKNLLIHPAAIVVRVGSTIKWVNEDAGIDHNVESESGASIHSNDFGGGGTFEFKVTKVGLIKYECSIHPASMQGTISVVR